MNEIKAYIRHEKAEEVIHALEDAGAPGIAAIEVKAMGKGAVPGGERLSVDYADWYGPIVKLEVVCDDPDTDRLVAVIREKAFTGHRGDGMIFVSHVGYAVKIRTGERCLDGLAADEDQKN